ncbi:MAG: ribosome-associated translation inhibitor RaiA [Roseburia sp.]|nr:ribosome-associated translation inhibitor RaiA [Anaeroplasma bactoclasticum]MCM1195882.1 ribosome-associated translation inhibitor RaiA [Roseburia sp.]MCM1556227.1 ribosome-associated translation inhibitor RaiA [Anaeroplasma bactoclasticum]
MKVEIVGKNGFTPSDANKEYALKKLTKLEGLLPDYENLAARVVCKVYKAFHKVEITIPAKNIILRAEVEEVDIYAAIDGAIDKLVRQVRHYNDRMKDKMGKKGIRTVDAKPEEERIVRDKNVDLEPMTREEAIDQMELLGHDFFIYLDKETRKTNVIYLRNDGNYAVIETTAK